MDTHAGRRRVMSISLHFINVRCPKKIVGKIVALLHAFPYIRRTSPLLGRPQTGSVDNMLCTQPTQAPTPTPTPELKQKPREERERLLREEERGVFF